MRPTGDPLLEVRGLTRRRDPARRGGVATHSVRDVSFSLGRGERVGLLGLNGAGKSTTLDMLAGCLVPDAGDVRVGGHDLADAPLEARALLGYLPDRPPVVDDMRVDAYLALAARLRRVPRARARAAADAAIDECALGEVRRQRIGTLSKGYRQRVGIAQAIVHRPALVLLDEPGSGLDPRQSEALRALVRRLGEGAAVIFSTHLLAEVRETCDRILVMHRGTLVADRRLGDGAPDGDGSDGSDDGEDIESLFARLVADAPPISFAGEPVAGGAVAGAPGAGGPDGGGADGRRAA